MIVTHRPGDVEEVSSTSHCDIGESQLFLNLFLSSSRHIGGKGPIGRVDQIDRVPLTAFSGMDR